MFIAERERSKLTKELVYNRKRNINSLKKYIVGRFRLMVLYYFFFGIFRQKKLKLC